MPLKKNLCKSVQSDKHVRSSGNLVKISKGQTVSTMKMTVATSSNLAPRIHHRKVLRLTGKRINGHKNISGKGRPCIRQSVDTCDNSNDSGLGFDHHMDLRTLHYAERNLWVSEVPDIKKRKIELKLEHDETNENYCFPETLRNCKENNNVIRSIPSTGIQNLNRAVNQNVSTAKNIGRCLPLVNRRALSNGPVTLTTQLSSSSRNGKIHLQIVCQPEQQHRARYQTEGSRGAVKDRTGNGFPIVKLIGYDKPTTLQIFIGTDLGRVAPHMFYQACRVSGKNSTPCIEKKVDGTIVIELELDPSKEMIATCDCVGILKERNVDVEHRFPEQLSPRSKKKSTKCRMVFRTVITHEDGSTEVLQVCSQPIVCTQPPGVPEICKKSLTSYPATGGAELFILGKNFLKDTRVIFQQLRDNSEVIWEETVIPDKEFLQQTHLVCVVPRYVKQNINEPVTIRLFVISSGKNSEPHMFTYTPVNTSGSTVSMEGTPTPSSAQFLSKIIWQSDTPKQEMDIGMMPPPAALGPLTQRRPSASMVMDTTHSPPMRSLKTELVDENSQGSVIDHLNENSMEAIRHRFRPISESSLDVHQGDSNITLINENSIDMLRHQEIIKKQIDIINENSNISIENNMDVNLQKSFHSEKSKISIHNEDSMESNSSPVINILSNSVLTTHTLVQPEIKNSNLNRDEMKGIDLRTKGNIGSVSDLVNSQPPSMATLRRFVLTEPTNMPLPTQTAQSVENYLTNLEKTVDKPLAVGDSPKTKLLTDQLLSVKPGSLLEQKIEINSIINQQNNIFTNPPQQAQQNLNTISQLLPNGEPSNNKIFNSLLTTAAPSDILPMSESQLKSNPSFELNQQNIMNAGPVMFSSPTNPLIESPSEVIQHSLQVALNENLMQVSRKLDLENLAMSSPIRSPQQELLLTSKSPLMASSPQEMLRQSPLLMTQPPEIIITATHPTEVLLNTQNPLLSSGMGGIIHSPHPEIVTVSSEVILDPQVSPSVMCRPQESLLQVNSGLNTLCQSAPTLSSCHVLPNTDMLSSEPSANSALLSNHLSPTIKTSAVSVENIVINGVDYLETQKKIAEMEMNTLMEQKQTQEQMISSIFEGQPQPSVPQLSTFPNAQVLLPSQVSDILKLNQLPQTQFVGKTIDREFLNQVNMNLQVPKQESNKSDLNQTIAVKQMNDATTGTVKKTEEGMITPALTNMSDNDLISYINPSCFDQGTFTS